MVTFWRSLSETNYSHWSEATGSLAYSGFFSLMPVLFGYVLLRVLSRHPTWSDFSHHGEFALYSAAMLGPALYRIGKDLKVPGFAGRSPLILVCVGGLLLATCFFTAVTTAFLLPKPVFEIDQSFLSSGTIALFGLSCGVFLVVTVLDNARLTPDVRIEEARQQDKLRRDFEDLGSDQ